MEQAAAPPTPVSQGRAEPHDRGAHRSYGHSRSNRHRPRPPAFLTSPTRGRSPMARVIRRAFSGRGVRRADAGVPRRRRRHNSCDASRRRADGGRSQSLSSARSAAVLSRRGPRLPRRPDRVRRAGACAGRLGDEAGGAARLPRRDPDGRLATLRRSSASDRQ